MNMIHIFKYRTIKKTLVHPDITMEKDVSPSTQDYRNMRITLKVSEY